MSARWTARVVVVGFLGSGWNRQKNAKHFFCVLVNRWLGTEVRLLDQVKRRAYPYTQLAGLQWDRADCQVAKKR